MTENPASHTIIYGLAAPPNVARSLLHFAAGTTGLMRSEDGGHTWSDALTSLALNRAMPVASVAVSPAFTADRTVVAGTSGGIVRSSDGGDSWQIVEFPSPPPFVTSLAFSPHYEQDGVIFAGTLEDGVFVSQDRGYHWHTWNFGLLDLNILALAISPAFAKDETIFAAVESGIFRSTNGGRAWRETPFDVDCAPVLSLALSPQFGEGGSAEASLPTASGGVLFAGTEGHGLFKSEDGGQSWKRLAPDRIRNSLDAILLSPNYPADPHLLALTGGTLLFSDDGAETWRPWPGASDIEQPLTAVLAPAGLVAGAPLLVGVVDHGVRSI